RSGAPRRSPSSTSCTRATCASAATRRRPTAPRGERGPRATDVGASRSNTGVTVREDGCSVSPYQLVLRQRQRYDLPALRLGALALEVPAAPRTRRARARRRSARAFATAGRSTHLPRVRLDEALRGRGSVRSARGVSR